MIDLSQEACDARLLSELRFLTAFAETVWDQTSWGTTNQDQTHFNPHAAEPCGTVACLAGWGAMHAGLAGPADHPQPSSPSLALEYEILINAEGQQLIRERGLVRKESRYHIQTDFFTLGMILFGLSDMDCALALFQSNHSLGSLWRYASIATAGRVTLPKDYERRVIEVDRSRYERFKR